MGSNLTLSPARKGVSDRLTRGLAVLYVENDEALLGLMAGQLSDHLAIGVLETASDSVAALKLMHQQKFDVALLDISLGPDSANGVELALAIREIQENCGIVLLSQHITPELMNHAPRDFKYGWSAIQKTADLRMDYLVDVLGSTARGLNVVDPGPSPQKTEISSISLSSRHRQIMGIASTGVDATEIANQLGLASVTVRQELSRIYKILIPDPKPGTDLRTTAVLNYLRLTRGENI